jgi:uncharacterized protein (DUF952 family)
MRLLTLDRNIILTTLTMHSDTQHKIQVVQAYIHHKTGKQVHIVFNNPMRVQQHLIMLEQAYQVAMQSFRNTKAQ